MGWLAAFKKIKILGFFKAKGGRKTEKAADKRRSKKAEAEAKRPAEPLKANGVAANGAKNGAVAQANGALGESPGLPMDAIAEWSTAADQPESTLASDSGLITQND